MQSYITSYYISITALYYNQLVLIVYIYIYICIYTCMYVYTCTHTHTHTHTHTRRAVRLSGPLLRRDGSVVFETHRRLRDVHRADDGL